jgi:hypothetical protein
LRSLLPGDSDILELISNKELKISDGSIDLALKPYKIMILKKSY